MNAPIRMSVLSQRTADPDNAIKLGGKIRPGIKVLTRKASTNALANDIYEKGVNARMKYSEIEKQILLKTGIANSMYPKNTPFYNVAASDFGMPEIADHIVERWGEMREGDTKKQLYRFPVVFHSDKIEQIYPNSFKRYGQLPHYESVYGSDNKRYCQYLPEVTKEMMDRQRELKIKRTPPRDKAIRGLCDPKLCPEYLSGQCKFKGRLQFYIPGIPSTGLVAIDTTSIYAAETIWAELERISKAFGGIPRSNPNKPNSYIFWLTKVQENRTYFDENGTQVIGLQWVPKLQADIDMGALLANTMPPVALAHTAPKAWLARSTDDQVNSYSDKQLVASENGHTPPSMTVDPMDAVEMPADQGIVELDFLIEELAIDEREAEVFLSNKFGDDWLNSSTHISEAIKTLRNMARFGKACVTKMVSMTNQANDLRLDQKLYQKYLTAFFGKAFYGSEEKMDSILAELAYLKELGAERALAFIETKLISTTGTR